ncbi:MAG TPA: biotin/lipoyl-containing protein, partial [Actinomycetota bacterium]|nr:biotin/lipoyl-containing protein [Actinomycetota bacterium]
MSATGGGPGRIAILEREPIASRVAGAARGLVPVVVRGTGAPPGIAARRVPGAVVVDADVWSVDGIAAVRDALAADPPDALWAGWGGWDHAIALAEACAEIGVRTAGPSADVLRALRDTAGCSGMAGLELAPETPPDAAVVEVATIAGDDMVPAVLGVTRLVLRPDGRVVLAEAPAGLADEAEAELGRAAVALRAALGARFGTVNAQGGVTLRLVLDGAGAALVSATPGIPPWFAAAEVACGFDAVAAQLDAGLGLGGSSARPGFDPSAAGPRLDRSPTGGIGTGPAAVAAVIRAEDPLHAFRPATGEVRALRLGAGPGIRLDPGAAVGDAVAPEGGEGAIVAVLTAEANGRAEARALLHAAVSQTAVVTSGGPTDRSALLHLLHDDEPHGRPDGGGEVALIDAAIAAHDERDDRRWAHFVTTAARGRADVGDDQIDVVEIRRGAHDYRFRVLHVGPAEYVVEVEGQDVRVEVRPTGPFERRLTLPDGPHDVVEVRRDEAHVVEVDGVLERVGQVAGSVTASPGPAVVVDVHVAEGDRVAAGDSLVVLEAMKMEMTLTASAAGTVRSVVGKNVQVGAGEPLVRIDVDDEPPADLPPARFDRYVIAAFPDASDGVAFRLAAGRLRRLVLGFDADPAAAGELAVALARTAAALPAGDADVLRTEEELLGTFADVTAVAAARRPTGPDAEFVPAPADPFSVYLRTLDANEALLPATFVDDLRRALARHGVRSLDPSPELQIALYRIARSNARASLQVPALVAILDRWLEHSEVLRGVAGPGARELLDRVAAAARGVHPAIADLAHEVLHRWFDQPLIEQAFDRQYDAVQRTLVGLALAPDRHRKRRIDLLVNVSLPLRAILVPTALAAAPPVDGAVLEALIRRYYRIRELGEVAIHHDDGRPVAMTAYPHEGTTVHLLAAAGTLDDLPALAAALARRADALPDGDVLTDYFLLATDALPPAAQLEERLRAGLDAAMPARRVRRAVATMCGPRQDLHAAREEHFTFRQPAAGEPFAEDRLYRGLHPMMGKRLDLWRLAAFDIERLPSVEDVYLFRAVGKENPKDERLVCLTEVRDLTPVLDDDGRVARLPLLERMFTEALAAIRLYQSHRPANRRVQWNRVLLHVRPVIDLGPDELFRLITRMAPLTEDLGLQKVLVRGSLRDPVTGEIRDRVMHISNPAGRGLTLRFDEPSDRPIRPLSPYWQKVVQARQRGLVYPYELMSMLAPGDEGAGGPFPPGTFVEHDLDDSETRLVPVERPPGENGASIVAGVVTNITDAYPEGMTRVAILGDPSRGLGSLAEAEC